MTAATVHRAIPAYSSHGDELSESDEESESSEETEDTEKTEIKTIPVIPQWSPPRIRMLVTN
jgi:hypothetical protein